MKTAVVFMIWGLLAFGPVVGQSCAADSKFLNMLKGLDKKIVLTTPNTGTTFETCQEVWKDTGSCCDGPKLIATFDRKMKESQKKGFDQFMNGLANLATYLKQIKELGAKKEDAKELLNLGIENNIIKPGDITVDQFVEMLSFVDTLPDDVAQFKVDGKVCFTATKDFVGKLLCFGCAAKPQEGFDNADGSTTITMSSCESLLDKCYTTWRFMHRVGGIVDVISTLSKAIKASANAMFMASGSTASSSSSGSATTQPLKIPEPPSFGSLNSKEIMTAFGLCKNSLSDASCLETAKANLCKANFNLWSPPKRSLTLQAELAAQLKDLQSLPALSQNKPKKRVLGTVTESTGDITVGLKAPDMTKPISVPQTTASVETSSTISFTATGSVSGSSGESSSGSSSSARALGIWILTGALTVLVIV